MGTRREKMIVVDLDGTLVRGNTMHMLMAWMARHLPVSQSVKICLSALRRLCRVDSHVGMKARILSVAVQCMAESDIDKFVDQLLTHVNPVVLTLSEKYDYRLLATAAPDLYAEKLAAKLGFDLCLASDTAEILTKYNELRGVSKRDRVQEYAAAKGLEVAAVVTDHSDDLPLLGLPGIQRYLVNPDIKLLHTLDKLRLTYQVVRDDIKN